MDSIAARLERVVKAYDVRGLVGEELDTDVARQLGGASARLLAASADRFVVGRDMRASSPELLDAFASGVAAEGLDVVDIGLASTDQLYYASGVFDAPGAMFTASHNPASYNGIKLCRAAAGPVSIGNGLDDIRDLAASWSPDPAKQPGERTAHDVLAQFASHARSFVDDRLPRQLSIAVDAGNGMAGHVWPAVVDGLPVSVEPLYFDLDGRFPNHPADPLDPDNLRDLCAAVVRGGHDLGIAFDGDGDRMFAVDDLGRAVSASVTGALLAGTMLVREPGATVLHSLICSRLVPDTIRERGGVPVRTRVGHSFVKARMAQTDALMAVEHSGHYYFRDHFRADSGVIAALILLQAVAAAPLPLSAIVDALPRAASSGEINIEVADGDEAIGVVARHFRDRGQAHREDGLTVDLGQAWFNLRASNTEPTLRLNVEADATHDVDTLVDEITGLLSRPGD